MITRDDTELREAALAQLQKKHEFYSHLAAYIMVNTLVVVIWWMTDQNGFFWPIFPIFGWGIGLFFHGWDVFAGPPSEGKIRREMERLDRDGR